MLKTLIILLMIALVVSLASGLVFLLSDQGNTDKRRLFHSLGHKWFMEHKKWVKIEPRDAYTYLEYHFFDKNGDRLK